LKLAIITARGGSKRIPGKNIKEFRGKPIIAYSIETAIQSGLFDLVMVSTDDNQIEEIAIKYGAKVPFKRSQTNSDDYASTADVIFEVLNEFKAKGREFEFACCIYPTAPFISEKNLIDAYQLMLENNFDTVFPVCQFSYPIQRALEINNSKISMVWKENLNKRSQDLQPRYHDAGQFYWLKTNPFLTSKKLFTENSGSIVLDELQVQDIDNETDWKIAELKHTILYP
jgi:N-acylneuraminate cytidylyltransferase